MIHVEDIKVDDIVVIVRVDKCEAINHCDGTKRILKITKVIDDQFEYETIKYWKCSGRYGDKNRYLMPKWIMEDFCVGSSGAKLEMII